MNELLGIALTGSIRGGIVIVAVLVLRLLLRKAPKKYICLLWILAGLRLLVPFDIESPFSLQPQMEPSAWSQAASREPEIQVETEPENGEEIGMLVWSAGMGVMLIYCIVTFSRLKWRLREAVWIGGRIWESDRIDTAFVLGYFRPRIYLPMNVPGEYRQMVLLHEEEHLKHWDHWLKLMMFVTLAIHWFNPLVWLAYGLSSMDMELACDEAVVASMNLEERKRYSAALLACSSDRSNLAVYPVPFGKKPIQKRIQAVLHYRKPSLWATVAAILAVLLVVLCFLTNPIV